MFVALIITYLINFHLFKDMLNYCKDISSCSKLLTLLILSLGDDKMKINKPRLQDNMTSYTFNNIYNANDPFINDIKIESSEINLQTDDLIEFTNVHFKDVKFNGSRFQRIFFKNCIFDNCDLSDSHFYEANLQNVSFNKCRLIGIVLTDARIQHVHFNQSNLQLASFGYSYQRYVIYDECILEESDFYENDLKDIDFTNSQLTGINLSQTSLNKIDLSNTFFTHLTVGLTDLKGCIVNENQAVSLAGLLGLVIK